MPAGLLIGGRYVDVPGLAIVNPSTAPWCKLDGRDYRLRRTPWVRQIILHTTKGKWPQYIRAGAGANGADRVVADFWRGDPNHSAAHIVIDRDGSVACLADLATVCAYHATVSNEWSVGIEIYQEGDGSIYEAAVGTCTRLVAAICGALSIPFQIAKRSYDGKPITRMVDGGADCVGIFGHRDNTDNRGRGDPGDLIYNELLLFGAEPFDYEARQDILKWQARQAVLNRMGEKLTVDGVAGPSTMRAMRHCGFTTGRAIAA